MRRKRPDIPNEEFARRGEALFKEIVRPLVARRAEDDFVAIDIQSGEFEVHPDEMEVCDRLIARIPDAQIWLRRVGPRPVYKILTPFWNRRRHCPTRT